MSHTKEPWFYQDDADVYTHIIRQETDPRLILCSGPQSSKSNAKDNMLRIVACVNACAGMDDPAAEIAALRAEVERLKAAAVPAGWQPIETAPHGIDMILAGNMDGPNDWRIKIGHRSNPDERDFHGFCIYGASWKPLLWMPLPVEPKAAAPAPSQSADDEDAARAEGGES